MDFHYSNLETCHRATGVVIVIDVIRAFTTAAFAFSGGAKEIHPVSAVEEALQFKARNPEVLICGEVGGFPPEGFDLGNSPSQMLEQDLSGRILVQRTGAGTQGITRSLKAAKMIAASFVVASATAKYVHSLSPAQVTFVNTGETYNGGEEDLACAQYLEELIKANDPDPAPYLERVRRSRDAVEMFFENTDSLFPRSDLEHCTHLDAFDFAMPVTKEDGGYVMRAIKP